MKQTKIQTDIGMSDTGAHAIAEALKSNTTLTKLNLSSKKQQQVGNETKHSDTITQQATGSVHQVNMNLLKH